MSKKVVKDIAARYQLSNLEAWQRAEVERAMLAAYRAGQRSRLTKRPADCGDSPAIDIDAVNSLRARYGLPPRSR